MAVSIQPKIAGLDLLETGIRTLKRSKLSVAPEFKDMLFAVERHHNDLRLAHLTGKAKDLLEQAQRDTKFYNILVKMLCEIKEKRSGEQRQGLRKVYTWYMANKHVLNSGPHFGKEQMKKEAKEILVKASTPRKAKNTQSTRSTTQSRASSQRTRAKSAPSVHIRWGDSTFDWRKDLEKGVTDSNHSPKVERLKLEQTDDDDEYEPELQRLATEGDGGQYTPLDTATTANSELLREARMLSRAHHGSPSMTPLGEQSPNVESSSVTPRKIVHPISSMVNPHAAMAAQLELEQQEKLLAKQKTGERLSRADSLQAWQNFNKNRSYGQDIIDRLSFVGRSGTPSDVRYFAHGEAEMPELHTQDAVTGYANVIASQHSLPEEGNDEQKENVFLQQTLEEFYQTADAMYPPREVRPVSRSRVKSAPAVGRHRSQSQPSRITSSATAGPELSKRKMTPQPNRLGHLLKDFSVEEEDHNTVAGDRTSVKLDTVVNIIDSVSEEMTMYRERLAPEAQSGFRQPMAVGLPTSSVSQTSVRLPSPSARSNSPVHGHQVPVQPMVDSKPPRPYSSPLASRQVQVGEEVNMASPRSQQPKDRCKSAGVIDWRGRVQPDTMRYKWGKTKFGGYTYLKKHLQKPINLRSAGSTSAGRRPKTAPVSIRDKWKTERASDANTRVLSQAASHSTTQIDQQAVDNMVSVQYLLGTSNSRADSLASLYGLDEEFLRSLRRSRANTPVHAPLEYMSFVSSSPAGVPLAERRFLAQDHRDDRYGVDGEDHHLLPNLDDLHLPLEVGAGLSDDGSVVGYVGDERDEGQQEETEKFEGQEVEAKAEEAQQESVRSQKESLPEDGTTSRSQADTEAVTDTGEITYVTSVAPSSKPPPVPASARPSQRKQPLSVSQVWQYSPAHEEEEEEGSLKPNFILGPSVAQWGNTRQPRKQMLCADCSNMTSSETAPSPRVQRSAGRMPGHALSASAQMMQLSRRHDELMRRVPPPRTPPSIPMAMGRSLKKERSPRAGPMLTELEHHARKVKSPRSFMQHVKDLRSSGDSRDISSAPSAPSESLTGTLQVCRLRIPLPRQRSTPLLHRDYSGSPDGLHSILKQPTEVTLHIETSLDHNEETDDMQQEKIVTFSHGDSPGTFADEPTTATEHFSNGLEIPESMSFMRQITASGGSSLHSSRSVSLHGSQSGSRNSSEPATPTSRNLAHIGRPIPQVTHVPDPDEVAIAVQKQREAAAAVDIQRIFRGYVARNAYKLLLSDERKRLEDKQRAAVEIQRMYRGHLSRKKAISRRPPNPEMLEWARNYRVILVANEQERQAKVEERAEELADNYHSAQSKLSVIGPHVNIYEIYHPKKTGPSKKELNVAAIVIQRHVRGWTVRRRFHKLHRKAAWYGSSFSKLVREYKAMLARVQRQHSVEQPQTPFTTKDMNDYIDIRRRYESVFEKKAFAGELELTDLDSFFKECDLYPSQAEIEEALDVAVKGSSADQGRSLKRHEVLDMVFYIYTPAATGLVNTRQSTWMNPIIDGVEARRLIGSEFVEDAPLEVCAKLVFDSKRERRQKEEAEEQARKDAEFLESIKKNKQKQKDKNDERGTHE